MSHHPNSLLVVDDDPGYRRMLAQMLGEHVEELLTASSGEEALEIVEQRSVGLVLLDMRMPGIGGLGFLEQLREQGREQAVLVLTAFADVGDAVQAMKLGALDYLKKPIDLQDLAALIQQHLGMRADKSKSALPALPPGVVFESPVMRDLLNELHQLARSEAPLLLTGESGTGKEVLAALAHAWSDRSTGPMVGVNVSTLPETLIESELFGCVRGAFTGADRTREGLIRSAHGGILFLDEIGEMPLTAQPKLLRVLETGQVTRVGETKASEVDFRLISATNRDLEAEVQAGRFRSDLYYRLAVATVEIPPLRDRREDLLPLANAFLSAASEPKQLSPAARAILLAYPWPGNIRELRNAMMRASILAPGDRILPEHLPPGLAQLELSPFPPGSPQSLAEIERTAILAALESHDGNRTHAAKELGISRRKLLYRLKEYGQSTDATELP